jgi:hypothetical protein
MVIERLLSLLHSCEARYRNRRKKNPILFGRIISIVFIKTNIVNLALLKKILEIDMDGFRMDLTGLITLI